MADNIEDAEWEEIPGNSGYLLKQATPRLNYTGSQAKEAETTVVPSVWANAIKWAKRFLIGLGLCFLFLMFIALIAPEPDEASTIEKTDDGGASNTVENDASIPTERALVKDDQLLGTWITAKTGGEDGLTDCREAMSNEAFIRRQDGSVGLAHYDHIGQFQQVFMKLDLDTFIKTEGNWVINGETISLVIGGAWIGSLSDDLDDLSEQPNLEGESTDMNIRFDGPNVMIQTNAESGVANRLVRCAD